MEDWEFNIRLSGSGFRGIELAKPLFVYSVRPDGMLLSRTTNARHALADHSRQARGFIPDRGVGAAVARATRVEPSVSAGAAAGLFFRRGLLPATWFNNLFFWLLARDPRATNMRGKLQTGGVPGPGRLASGEAPSRVQEAAVAAVLAGRDRGCL